MIVTYYDEGNDDDDYDYNGIIDGGNKDSDLTEIVTFQRTPFLSCVRLQGMHHVLNFCISPRFC
jgi:hypothetical protein